jgi:hypothetical protein
VPGFGDACGADRHPLRALTPHEHHQIDSGRPYPMLVGAAWGRA